MLTSCPGEANASYYILFAGLLTCRKADHVIRLQQTRMRRFLKGIQDTRGPSPWQKFCNFAWLNAVFPPTVSAISTVISTDGWSWISTIEMANPEKRASTHQIQTHEAEPDVLLMLEVARGHEPSLVALMEKWQGPLINFFYRSLGSREQAEDLTQVLFVKLYRAAPRYEPRAKFSTYLFSIARHLMINEWRKSRRDPLGNPDPEALSWQMAEDSDRRVSEIEEAFHAALQQLPPNHRNAILLYQQQELSYQEIAEVMDATESSVKTWIFRARQKLKELLKDHLESEPTHSAP